MKKINFALKQARMEKRMPAWILAHRVGLYPQRFSLIEQGRLLPEIELQRKIAKELGKTLEELFQK